ncbi:nucleoporin Nup35 [Ischnura elegans]|uniref:nucleoporin Nup35 n=1 Tax=Ischnura elegans TaxID=197161 RepID=UPI001ED8B7A5|nr:nucleoporin Nup35 [Ischnura elegans]
MEPMALGSPVGSPSGTPSSPTTSPFLPSFLMGDSAPNVTTPRTNVRQQQTPRHVTFGANNFTMPPGHLSSLPQPIGNSRSLQSVTSPEKATSDFGPPTLGLFDTLSPLPSASTASLLNSSASYSLASEMSNSRLLPSNHPSMLTSPVLGMDNSQQDAVLFGSEGQEKASVSLAASSSGKERGLAAGEAPPSSSWVTVFGFAPHAVNDVLAHFVHCGTIVEQRGAGGKCNWLHLRFRSPREARRALGKNGKVFGGCMMVGVVPCQDPEILSSQKENVPGPEVSFPSLHQRTSDGSLSGMRPLGLDQSSSWKESPKARSASSCSSPSPPGAIRPLMKTVSSPQSQLHTDGSAKPSGLLSKTIDFLFGQ